MVNTPIASDLSYQVLERRRRLGELATPPCDQAYRPLYRGSCTEFLPSTDDADGAHPNPSSVAVGEREQ